MADAALHGRGVAANIEDLEFVTEPSLERIEAHGWSSTGFPRLIKFSMILRSMYLMLTDPRWRAKLWMLLSLCLGLVVLSIWPLSVGSSGFFIYGMARGHRAAKRHGPHRDCCMAQPTPTPLSPRLQKRRDFRTESSLK
ncbi:MAG: hypothetical protein CSA70_02675 [Rhodobacterales bacterium]|nr:MAG: hypothetical protein CSA70_02675 [Rhodobacterales bacterium]